MAQSKFSDLAGKFGKGGGPPGLGLGLKLLAVGGVAAYGLSQSMYTGKYRIEVDVFKLNSQIRMLMM